MDNDARTEFLNLCRNNGWKCTSQRMAVYDFLRGNMTHPDVDTVWTAVRRALPAITRESVYRILNEFSGRNVIRRLDHIDNARYDSRTEPHGHFICERCGGISDFNWPAGAQVPLVPGAGQVRHMEIRLVGICDRCTGMPEEAGSRKGEGILS